MAETLTEKLKRIRKEKKLTMIDLSLRMRVSKATISAFEKGTVPTPHQADLIRAFLSGKI